MLAKSPFADIRQANTKCCHNFAKRVRYNGISLQRCGNIVTVIGIDQSGKIHQSSF